MEAFEYKSIPTRLEGGTPPIAEVIGLGAAVKYLQSIGMDKIASYEADLKKIFTRTIATVRRYNFI